MLKELKEMINAKEHVDAALENLKEVIKNHPNVCPSIVIALENFEEIYKNYNKVVLKNITNRYIE